jgi:flagellar hook assembly protein FlgD
MKKVVSLFAAALLVMCGVMFADVFASRTAITNPNGSPFDGKLNDGTGVKIWYYLNDTATVVVVKVLNATTNAVVATINASNQGRFSNPNSVTWDGTGSAVGSKYYITITTTGLVYSDVQYTSFYFQQTSPIGDISTGIFTRGVDINNNMKTKGFGYWYASNSDGGTSGYKTGALRYNPDGSFAGTVAGHPSLTNSLGTANGGTFNWGSTAPWTAALDSKGRVYQVSNGGNFVTRLDNDSAAPKIIFRNITAPRGVFATGEGANLKLYIAADTVVWRANIGNSDTLTTPLELVASLGNYVRDVILDDAGFLIATLRTGAAGAAPGYVERYDISSGLPKKRSDATFSITHLTGTPVCLALKHGADKNSASDDTLYYSIRGLNGTDTLNLGIHEVTMIDGFFEAKRIFKSGDVPGSAGGNNNANADFALDWGGNIVWFENANEEIFMVATPRKTATVTLTTQAYDTISVQNSTSVGKNGLNPNEFALHQNYPNPFNPSTVISYSLPSTARISVIVYDILGNVVNELFTGTAQQGYNAVVWNGSNSAGGKVASGMYLYRITAQMDGGRAFSDTKRMLMLK